MENENPAKPVEAQKVLEIDPRPSPVGRTPRAGDVEVDESVHTDFDSWRWGAVCRGRAVVGQIPRDIQLG